MKFLLAGLILGLYVSAIPVVVFAEETTIRQRILPADCIFDVIDVGGVQQFNFYTPEACGVVTPSPPNNDPNTDPNNDSSDINDTLSILRRGGQITVTEVVTDINDNKKVTNKDTDIQISDTPLSQETTQTKTGNSVVQTIAIIGGVLLTVGVFAYVGTIILAKNGFILFGNDPDIEEDDNPPEK